MLENSVKSAPQIQKTKTTKYAYLGKKDGRLGYLKLEINYKTSGNDEETYSVYVRNFKPEDLRNLAGLELWGKLEKLFDDKNYDGSELKITNCNCAELLLKPIEAQLLLYSSRLDSIVRSIFAFFYSSSSNLDPDLRKIGELPIDYETYAIYVDRNNRYHIYFDERPILNNITASQLIEYIMVIISG